MWLLALLGCEIDPQVCLDLGPGECDQHAACRPRAGTALIKTGPEDWEWCKGPDAALDNEAGCLHEDHVPCLDSGAVKVSADGKEAWEFPSMCDQDVSEVMGGAPTCDADDL